LNGCAASKWSLPRLFLNHQTQCNSLNTGEQKGNEDEKAPKKDGGDAEGENQKRPKSPNSAAADQNQTPLKKRNSVGNGEIDDIDIQDSPPSRDSNAMEVSPVATMLLLSAKKTKDKSPLLKATTDAEDKKAAATIVNRAGDRSLFDFGVSQSSIPQDSKGKGKASAKGAAVAAGATNDLSSILPRLGLGKNHIGAGPAAAAGSMHKEITGDQKMKAFYDSINREAADQNTSNVIQEDPSKTIATKTGKELKLELFADENNKEHMAVWKRFCSIGGMKEDLLKEAGDAWDKASANDEDAGSKKNKTKKGKILAPVMLIRLRALVNSCAAIMAIAKQKIPDAGKFEEYQVPTSFANCMAEMRICEEQLKTHKTKAASPADKLLIQRDIDEFVQMHSEICRFTTTLIDHLLPDLETIVDDVKTFSEQNPPRQAREYYEKMMEQRFGHLQPFIEEEFKEVKAKLDEEEQNKRRAVGGGNRRLKRKNTFE